MIKRSRVEITSLIGFILLMIICVAAVWIAEFLIREIGFVMMSFPGLLILAGFIGFVGWVMWRRRRKPMI